MVAKPAPAALKGRESFRGMPQMKFFVDTADTAEIRDLAETGLLDGVTTNPSLVHKAGRDFLEVVQGDLRDRRRAGLGRGGRARP